MCSFLVTDQGFNQPRGAGAHWEGRRLMCGFWRCPFLLPCVRPPDKNGNNPGLILGLHSHWEALRCFGSHLGQILYGSVPAHAPGGG